MDAYCGETISWGPITVKEAKRILKQTPTKIERRNTDLGIAPRDDWYVEIEDMILNDSPTKIISEEESEEEKAENLTENSRKTGEDECRLIDRNSIFKLCQIANANNSIIEKENDFESSSESLDFSLNQSRLSTINEDNSILSTENNSINRSRNNSTNSNCFNDTIEEIEAILKMNQLGIKSDDRTHSGKSLENLPLKPQTPPKTESLKTIPKPTPINRTKLLLGTNNNPKTINSGKPPLTPSNRAFGGLFKLPKTPTTNTKSPKTPSYNNKFKDIVSPVGVYIKNSPGFYLKTNIKSNIPIKTTAFPPSTATKAIKSINSGNEEELEPIIPEIVYKPSKERIFLSNEKPKNLPAGLQELGTEIIKHEKKIRNPSKSNRNVAQKLLEDDLTLMSDISCSFNSTTNQDISILTSKQHFIK